MRPRAPLGPLREAPVGSVDKLKFRTALLVGVSLAALELVYNRQNVLHRAALPCEDAPVCTLLYSYNMKSTLEFGPHEFRRHS